MSKHDHNGLDSLKGSNLATAVQWLPAYFCLLVSLEELQGIAEKVKMKTTVLTVLRQNENGLSRRAHHQNNAHAGPAFDKVFHGNHSSMQIFEALNTYIE